MAAAKATVQESPAIARVHMLTSLPTGQLFAALSEALNNQVRSVTTEKKEMMDEARNIIITIRQMEASLDGSKQFRRGSAEHEEFPITYPLIRCLQGLQEKHGKISRLHKERFEQVKSESVAAEQRSECLC